MRVPCVKSSVGASRMNVDSRKSMAAYEGDSENKTLETEKEVDVLVSISSVIG